MLTPRERRRVLLLAVDIVVDTFVDMHMSYGEEKPKPADDSCARARPVSSRGDGVHAYAHGVLAHGLLYMEFRDGIREGDGYRILRCWRYFLLYSSSRQGGQTIP